MKKTLFILIIVNFYSLQILYSQPTIKELEIDIDEKLIDNEGYFNYRFRLKHDAVPNISILEEKAQPINTLSQNFSASAAFYPDVHIVKEKKTPYALLRFPIYKKNKLGVAQLQSVRLKIQENEPNDKTLQRYTTVESSVLGQGTWHKIAIKEKGVYKIDYNMLVSMGLQPENINPNHIRLFGNGGNVLPERVSDEDPDDLIENAIFVSSTGSKFGNNDYVLFYANGPILHIPDTSQKIFTHLNHWYEDYSYYFLTIDNGTGKRIQSANAQGGADIEIDSYAEFLFMESDSYNIAHVGRTWYGHQMNSMSTSTHNKTLQFNIGTATSPIKLNVRMGVASDVANSQISISANNQPLGSVDFPTPRTGYFMIDLRENQKEFSTNSSQLDLKFQFRPRGTAQGYIDYVSLNYQRALQFHSGQFTFASWQSMDINSSQSIAYNIGNTNANLKVWEVTNPLEPVELQGNLSGNTYKIVRHGGILREFVAFDGSYFRTPTPIGKITNQNLHGLPQTDYIIITVDSFLPAANRLANFHRQRENMHVTVATVREIYNEFSSGSQDIGAIRNFVKMFYDRANNIDEMPKYLLLLGAASYDFKNRIANNTNLVPTFISFDDKSTNSAYTTDDFFTLLDAGEWVENNVNNMVDIAVGRIPAKNLKEANDVVNKIEHYVSKKSYGPWKNRVTYVSDDAESSMNHLGDCLYASDYFFDNNRLFNVYNIHPDAYKPVNTPSGNRYPMINKSINDRIFTGTLMMSYSGHGGPDRWADEAILTPNDYNYWNNIDRLPLLHTGTCDFGRFDALYRGQPYAGVKLLLNPNGGAIGLITTTALVYPGGNRSFSRNFVLQQFEKDNNGQYRTMGEVVRICKNDLFILNSKRHTLLGDPALKLQIPTLDVQSTALFLSENDEQLTETDTIKALGRYVLKGLITDSKGAIIPNFNGDIYVTIFDKIREIKTIHPLQNTHLSFQSQTNAIAGVRGEVKNGEFEVFFIAPKDIIYDFGQGKISYYAHSDNQEASGLDTNIVVGGLNPNAPIDNDGPIVNPYIDNEKFIDGGVTGPNPLLYVKLFDENGINVSGNSIGHDLVAYLDEDLQNPFVMNDYYQTMPNEIKNGYVYFPLYNLPDGKHTVRVKAWDVYNNSGEGTVTFTVENKQKGFISHLYNYPNPFSDYTHIVFQHNQENESMDLRLEIFTPSGNRVYIYEENITTQGNRSELLWDGRDNGGIPLPNGIYLYRLHIKTKNGAVATAYEKLVLRK